tara:strand:- start:506 stop:1405 length:900 start_codon:yes stop_codon:yes gene_type:complete
MGKGKYMIKIACIGCSWTQGSPPEHIPYPKILYHLLKKQGINATVYNFGIGGTGAKIHKAVYEWANYNFKLDYIVHQITDEHRTELTSEGSLDHAFISYQPDRPYHEETYEYVYNMNDLYYEIRINEKPGYWATFPIWDFLGLPLEKPTAIRKVFFRDDYAHDLTEQEYKKQYNRYFAKNPIITFQQFMAVCKYKYHYARETEMNRLDMISDIDHIINHVDKKKRLTFFWKDQTLKIYKDYKKKHKQKHEKFISMQTYFKSMNKGIKSYSYDDYLHLNTKGNELVAKYIMKNLKNKGII